MPLKDPPFCRRAVHAGYGWLGKDPAPKEAKGKEIPRSFLAVWFCTHRHPLQGVFFGSRDVPSVLTMTTAWVIRPSSLFDSKRDPSVSNSTKVDFCPNCPFQNTCEKTPLDQSVSCSPSLCIKYTWCIHTSCCSVTPDTDCS